jgi:hypothetical protein
MRDSMPPVVAESRVYSLVRADESFISEGEILRAWNEEGLWYNHYLQT